MGGFSLLVAALALGAPSVQVKSLDGGSTNGTLNELSSRQIALTTDSGPVDLPLARLLNVVPDAPSKPSLAEKPSVWIELIDGSQLTGARFTVDANDMANIELGPNHRARLRTSVIRSVRFSDPHDTSSPTWPSDVGTQAAGDLLAIRKNDHVDFLEGRLGKVTDAQVVLTVDGESYPANRPKVDGLVYFHNSAAEQPTPLCTLDDTCGWHLKAKEISLSSAGQDASREAWLKVTLSSGAELNLPWSNVERLDFSAEKVVYLSDLEPESFQWTPYVDFGKAAPAMAAFYGLHRDQGREGPLKLGDKTYAKGLSLCSRSLVVYRVPQGMKKFQTKAGIDDSVRDIGNVRLEISADGKKLWDQSVSGNAPANLDLDIAGARRLSILVDFGDDQDAGDFLNLVDARMLK
jgi:hypothetical protein